MMKHISNLRAVVQNACLRLYPRCLLHIKHPTFEQMNLALSRQPSLYPYLGHPDYTAAYMTLMHAPKFLRMNPRLPHSVQKELVTAFPYALNYLCDPDIEIYKEALRKDSSLLKGKSLSPEFKEAVYEWRNDLFPSIKDPQESLQIRAVKDDWKNFYLLRSPSDAVLQEMVRSFLGMDQAVDSDNRGAWLHLFTEWKDIEDEYKDTPVYSLSQLGYVNAGYEGYPEELRQMVYYHRYRFSVAGFKQQTGIKIDPKRLVNWDDEKWKEELRVKAITEGVHLSPGEEIPYGEDLYHFCHLETVKGMKDRAYKQACSILGKKGADELQEMLRKDGLPLCYFTAYEFQQLRCGEQVDINLSARIQMNPTSGILEKEYITHTQQACSCLE